MGVRHMTKYLGYIAGLVILVTSFIWYVQHLKGEAYKGGYNEAAVLYESRMADMRAAIERSNAKAIELREKQIISYQRALEVRNSQYQEIDKELKSKLDKLEEFENEDDKDWFNTPVPDAYR